MAKRNSPALYELIRHRGGEHVPPAHHDSTETEPSPPVMPAGNWLRPGRSIQIPVGYLFVAIAMTLGVVVLTYVIAFERGKESGRYVSEEEIGLMASGDRGGPLLDPLTQSETEAAGSGGARQSASRPRERTAVGGEWRPITSDPRQRGRAYFILAQTTESGAMRLAEFCREHGLEAYVVSGNNARLRRVIALPGFQPNRASSAEARQLRQKIHDIGREWTQAGLGRWDYHEAYLSEY